MQGHPPPNYIYGPVSGTGPPLPLPPPLPPPGWPLPPPPGWAYPAPMYAPYTGPPVGMMLPGMAFGYPARPPLPPPGAAPHHAHPPTEALGAAGAAGAPGAAGAAFAPSVATAELPADPFGVEAEDKQAQHQQQAHSPPQQQPQSQHPPPQRSPPKQAAAAAAASAPAPATVPPAASTAVPAAGNASKVRRVQAAGAGLPDGPPAKEMSKKQAHEAVARAAQQLERIFPNLRPALRAWLLHQLVARFAKVPLEDLLPPGTYVPLPIENALSASNTLAFGPPHAVAEVAAELLDWLKGRYLAGEPLLGAATKNINGVRPKKKGTAFQVVCLVPAQQDASALSQAVLEVLADASRAAPKLPPRAAQHSTPGKHTLRPPPPAPQRGSIVAVPDPLQALFSSGSGVGSSGLLRQLLKNSLEQLDAAAALATGLPDSGGRQLPLRVSPDIDFGTVAVSCLEGEHLQQAAASVAAGLPLGGRDSNGSSGAGYASSAAAAASLLDLLHLSSVRPQQPGPSAAAEDGSTQAALHFRELLVENTSKADSLWLLGGVAAPAFPHTLAAVDDARLFWLEGHKAVRLDPLQQHTISVALSSADCAARRQESGVLQQLLLLLFAAPPHTDAAQLLGELEGAPFADLPAAPSAGSSSGGIAGGQGHVTVESATEAAMPAAAAAATATAGVRGMAASAAPAAAAMAPPPAAPFRLFVVARRVTVALVDRPAELSAMLDADAKPYIAEHLRQLFNHAPEQPAAPHTFPRAALKTLACGALEQSKSAAGPSSVAVPWAASQKGQATVPQLPVGTEGSLAAPLLQRYCRLLALEEAAMEQDICRYDMWNVRLRLAVFTGSTTRYGLVSLAPSPASTAGTARQGGLYRGPAVEMLQPGGVGDSAHTKDGPVYVLGVLDVPGLPELRPQLLLKDTVYLRSAHEPQREIAALVAATDGSTAFLLLSPGFWGLPDVAPLVPSLAAGEASFGSTGLFDGLVHARFSFDRSSLQRMQRSLAAAARKQLLADACWLPPGELPAVPGSPRQQRQQQQEQQQEEFQRRMQQLQPAADAVAQAAAGLQEQGSQRPLNAEQRQAVAAVVCGAGRAMPYALFGPPGTGKTLTLVEAALQLLKAYPHARLLLCAPQNYSADLLCSALAAAGMQPGHMLRLYDPRRPTFTAKEDVLRFCCFNEATRMFTVPSPPLAEAASWRVVVSTCSAAALLREGAYEKQPLHFTHVLIDEAGQALLPEALIPLALLASASATRALQDPGWGAVLCGDPRQLGPVVRSRAAAEAGLGTSLLELCISHHSAAAFEVMKLGRVPATSMLIKNYRSHHRLLDLPSRLFYQGSLVPAADQSSVLPPRWGELTGAAAQPMGEEEADEGAFDAEGEPLQRADEGAEGEMAGEGVVGGEAGEEEAEAEGEEEEEEEPQDASSLASLLFYGVRGQQLREGEAPSWFNPIEASVVVDLVSGLLAAGPGVHPDQLGIMAPYRKQVQKIRLLLRQRGLGSIRVGTVDDYQGQEERCIFISTVLSKPESLLSASSTAGAASDTHLGFWGNVKRFNVAVTRAKALLVVVGHPAVLLEDASWRELLRHCFASGAFRGAGSDTIRQRFRVEPGTAAGALPELAGEEAGSPEELEDAELQRAIGQLAELALLGAGRADEMFPRSLDEMYAAQMDEAPFRVML